jgi:hypothetical protein
MEVYGDECLSHTQIFEWIERFKEGRGEIEDDPHPGRPCTSNTDAYIEMSAKLFEEIVA